MDEKKLELTLGLPGDNINWASKNTIKTSVGVIGCGKEHDNHPWVSLSSSSSCCSQKFHATTCSESGNLSASFMYKGLSVMGKDSSQHCCTRISDLQTAEKKGFSPSSVNDTAVPVTNTSQKRAAPAVGWPPIRSFRKNLGSTSTGKTIPEPQGASPRKPVDETRAKANKGQFVKINMDGVPIGRKVDLSAYNNYDTLSSAVDQLFRGLLAAQRDSCDSAKDKKEDEQKAITGVLDGNGEYTLVYEDNEGDRVLVGDVPWHMFVSTVKRLRVLKSSDLPKLNCGRKKEGNILVDNISSK